MPCNLAGSAIAQGPFVGRIDPLSTWEPTLSVKQLWLLLAGASNPPRDIDVSDRRTRDIPGVTKNGTFLPGVTQDLANVENAVGTKLFNTVKDLYLTKSVAFEHIRKLFDLCKREDFHPMLYYTGHGEIGTGNWCFSDGTISIEEILDMLPGGTYYPIIFSDACYSGNWANYCLNGDIGGAHCLAACPEFSTAIDTKGEGGDLTLFMTGKKTRPSTEPIYSEGNRLNFPITSGYDSVRYTDLITSYVRNSQNILISQSMHDGYFYGCFAPSKRHSPRPLIFGGNRDDHDAFTKLVREMWQGVNGKRFNIYSLAYDEKYGFGAFFMENYGTRQSIILSTETEARIKDKYGEGFKITACAARGSTFYVVMTKDVDEYKGNKQKIFVTPSWDEAESLIKKIYEREKATCITGICYSPAQRRYFVVMTELHESQAYKWFDEGSPITPWLNKKHEQGFHPTIIFKDPTDNAVLVVVTTDKSRSTYKAAINYKIK